AQLPRAEDRLRAFMLGYAAGLTTYDKCLRLIRLGEQAPLLRAKLDEPDDKFGLAAGFFAEILEANTSWRNHRLLAHADRFWRRHRASLGALALDEDPLVNWLPEVMERGRRSVRTTLWSLFRRRLCYDLGALWRSAQSPLGTAVYALEAFFGTR